MRIFAYKKLLREIDNRLSEWESPLLKPWEYQF